MIKLLQQGIYKLIETKNQTKILILDEHNTYAWINIKGIGEMLVSSHKNHKADYTLNIGNYRIYKVKNEPHLSDHIHLELSIGRNNWQGYLLLTGLPTEAENRNRIIPTKEIISKTIINDISN